MHTEVCIGLDIAHFPSLMYGFIMQQAVSIGHSYGIHSTYVRTLCTRMDQCMYVCMMYVCMYVCMYVRTYGHGWMDTRTIDVYYAECNVVSYLAATTHVRTYKTLLWCGGALHELYTTCCVYNGR